MTRQYLIIDADDTLWENNIYFERAFEEFVAFLDHSSLTPREVRDVLDEMEAANAKIHGYGSKNFGRNLGQCYQHLAEREIREDDLQTVMGFAERILECPMEVIPGVRETLAYLAGAARSHAVHQGACGRTEVEDRSLRAGRVLPTHGDRERERCGGVPAAGGGARDGRGGHVDDRE